MLSSSPTRLSQCVRHMAHLCLALTVGCGDGSDPPQGPEPLRVTATSPVDGDGAVETGVVVTATFDGAVDPATITARSFVLTAAGAPLASRVEYDAATRTARLVGPLIPATTYQVELTADVTDEDGIPLTPEGWSFTTRGWQSITLDQDAGPGKPASIRQDGGRLHVVYTARSNPSVVYATCSAECTTPGSWTAAVAVERGSSPSLAVDGGGRLHLGFYPLGFGLAYTTCEAGCVGPLWPTVPVDQATQVPELGISLAADEGGRLHLTYYDDGNSQLKYATCASACSMASSWTAVAVDQSVGAGWSTSLALGPDGRLHVSYVDLFSAELKYATCASACTAADDWTVIPVDADGGRFGSLAVDAAGRVHVSYQDPVNRDLKYATCAADCTVSANWSVMTADAGGSVGSGTSLAVDADGRLHVAYLDNSEGDLKYATCAAACTTAAGWQSAALHRQGVLGIFPSLAVGRMGRLHVVYSDEANAGLQYLE
jgi:hypothetical protein